MSSTFRGKAWTVGDEIDTDQIYHGQYLPLTDPEEMAKHAMEFVPGMENFVSEVRDGDIIVAGRNFGTGSSREHAVQCLIHSGISCIVAESFARIFYRNAINLALPILECPGISRGVETGHELEVEAETGDIIDLTTGQKFEGKALSGLEREIGAAGGLLPYLRREQASGKRTG
jgi:3-isopropylmalate/(R)-2-methylmalate dehydratase small subunit